MGRSVDDLGCACRQLAEKYQQLVRKYERESKANKRLSMDKEELMWRLTQGDTTPDTLRRSLSRSPTADPAPDTPTPATSTSLRPTVVQRPKTCTSSLRSESQSANLRRSGTYELLSQDADDSAEFDRQAE